MATMAKSRAVRHIVSSNWTSEARDSGVACSPMKQHGFSRAGRVQQPRTSARPVQASVCTCGREESAFPSVWVRIRHTLTEPDTFACPAKPN
eukprot:2201244-Pleurochrysis_carterae.AAC.1